MNTASDLLIKQNLPLDVKEVMSKNRIKEAYEYFNGQVYVSFSGGKDSLVLLDLCRKLYPNMEAVFCDTGLEYPEIRKFVKSFDNVTWIKPEQNFKDIIAQQGYPVISKEVARAVNYARKKGTKSGDYYMQKFNGTLEHNGKKSQFNLEQWKFLLEAPFKINDTCCNVMKKRPFHKYEKQSGKIPITGSMASESRLRKQKWIQKGCNSFDGKKKISNPLSFWKDSDILEYIVKHDLNYCSVYGVIIKVGDTYVTTECDRTGCMFCMFGCHLEDESRFKRIKKTHPKIYDYCMKDIEDGGLGIKKVMDFLNIDC